MLRYLTLQVIVIIVMDFRLPQHNFDQVVRITVTVHQIQKRAGWDGVGAAAGQLADCSSETTTSPQTGHNRDKLTQAIETFTNFCAGYCVATQARNILTCRLVLLKCHLVAIMEDGGLIHSRLNKLYMYVG